MTSYSANRPLSAIQVILLSGLVAGTLDITAACVTAWIQSSVTPPRIFKYIATGVLGAPALTAGAGTAALGLLLHYVIATGWAVLFYLVSRKVGLLINHAVTSGLLYGLVVYGLMNFVVVPLSLVPARRTSPPLSARALQAAILMVCIGLPIALIVRRFGRPSHG
jgi:uncharacterized membrane protein YagU involved in acid resistance